MYNENLNPDDFQTYETCSECKELFLLYCSIDGPNPYSCFPEWDNSERYICCSSSCCDDFEAKNLHLKEEEEEEND